MVRIKLGGSETVKLLLTGPRSIIPESLEVEARLTQTWRQLLIATPGLNISPESGIFVCSQNYTPTAPQTGVGWRSELHEPIYEFIKKFIKERNRKQFVVRLSYPHNPSSNSNDISDGTHNNSLVEQGKISKFTVPQNASADPLQEILPPHSASISPPVHPGGRHGKRQHEQTLTDMILDEAMGTTRASGNPVNANGVNGGSQQQRKRGRFESSVKNSSNGQAEVIAEAASRDEPEGDDDHDDILGVDDNQQRNGNDGGANDVSGDSGQGEEDSDNDNASVLTAATVEENELRRDGIQMEDLKTFVEGRMARFSNAFIIRVREEIRKLRQNRLWDRNVSRSPLACYLLQEMFKD